jgi:hypothetical protein
MLCQSCVEHGVEVVRERRFFMGGLPFRNYVELEVRFVFVDQGSKLRRGVEAGAPWTLISVLFITSFSVIVVTACSGSARGKNLS